MLACFKARLLFTVFGGNIVLHIIQHAQRRSTIICCKLNELHNRGWYYHKDNRFWFIRVPNMEPLVRTNTYERGSYHCFDPNTFETYERGSYHCFDPNTFETVRKDNFVLHYEMLEKRPPLPQHRVGIRTFIVEFQL
ncbi:probable NOT transcription complex subunit VIP2 [Arachis stenosperma]|uniref:probable NOT transcription complex subunit VIP2 n=1 Tax=Arachis stenosperma TaxID=217475 RepID=UPI0025ACF4AF|nr:probable NOT transcription complex subunit VIP2 [Arachis stenosperma]